MGLVNNNSLNNLANYDFETNKGLIVLNKRTDKIEIIDKSLVNCWNQFLAFFGLGKLAKLTTNLEEIGNFIAHRITLMNIDAHFIDKIVEDTTTDPKNKKICINICAIANRLFFIHRSHNRHLFDRVSTEKTFKGVFHNRMNEFALDTIMKTNPEMNGRYLKIIAQKNQMALLRINITIWDPQEILKLLRSGILEDHEPVNYRHARIEMYYNLECRKEKQFLPNPVVLKV